VGRPNPCATATVVKMMENVSEIYQVKKEEGSPIHQPVSPHHRWGEACSAKKQKPLTVATVIM